MATSSPLLAKPMRLMPQASSRPSAERSLRGWRPQVSSFSSAHPGQ